eukprot:IDg6562t1
MCLSLSRWQTSPTNRHTSERNATWGSHQRLYELRNIRHHHRKRDRKAPTIYTDQPIPPSGEAKEMTLDDVDLSDLDEGQKGQVKQMLSPYSDMWSDRFSRVSVAEHHIELEPDTRPGQDGLHMSRGGIPVERHAVWLMKCPTTYQRAIDILLAGFKWSSCLVYLDDIIIFSATLEEHLVHVKEILKILKSAGFSLKLRKCSFFKHTVDYLGHLVRPILLSVAEKNTASIKEAKFPETKTQMRSFLGMCNV